MSDHVRLLRLNVEAMVDLFGRFVPPMVERRRGAVLNVCSLSSFIPWPAMATYAASKAAALSFTEALHTELRPLGVAVTAVCPGFRADGVHRSGGYRRGGRRCAAVDLREPRRRGRTRSAGTGAQSSLAVHSLRYRSSAAILRALPNGVVLFALDRWSPFRRGGLIAGAAASASAHERSMTVAGSFPA